MQPLNIALIGYGKMGRAIEALATSRGHNIAACFDSSEALLASPPQLAQCSVAIEFTQPTAAAANIRHCLQVGVPVVCGTTGWYAEGVLEQLAATCEAVNGRMLTSTNFSVGMNIMFAINERLAALMAGRTDYTASITETHHIHKLDAPSGTAITLRQQVQAFGSRSEADIAISSIREGEVPGTHTVSYASDIDTISITHEAHNRRGLAAGALLAAEWLAQAQPGVYTMKDVLAL